MSVSLNLLAEIVENLNYTNNTSPPDIQNTPFSNHELDVGAGAGAAIVATILVVLFCAAALCKICCHSESRLHEQQSHLSPSLLAPGIIRYNSVQNRQSSSLNTENTATENHRLEP